MEWSGVKERREEDDGEVCGVTGICLFDEMKRTDAAR
jgi:hypothetical protein